jgi:AAA domain
MSFGAEELAMDAIARADKKSKAAGPWKFYDDVPIDPPRWLIKGILPEVGIALMSGQWGTFKTTAALDLCVSVMTETQLAGRYLVKRKGAVLYIALEGAGRLAARLKAIAEYRGISGPLPFAWRTDCPSLTNNKAGEVLCALADDAKAEFEANFGLPIVLVLIDTIVRAANHDEGGDNDAAASQRVMNALSQLSEHLGALVVGIDHFGKTVETGTRGSSAKEGAADTVIALLADRETSGAVKNTRLAMRKQRDGVSGFEIPFTVKTIETGIDQDGEPITATVIEWPAADSAKPAATKPDQWAKSLRLLRQVLMNILAASGSERRPFADGPIVRAVDLELVRTEFYKSYPATGDTKTKNDARRQAFTRAIRDAGTRGLVATREIGSVTFVWLVAHENA